METPPPPLFSHHVFIFPFSWDLSCGESSKRAVSFSERTKLLAIRQKMGHKAPCRCNVKGMEWERFKFDWSRDFNEAIYFHSFAREALFDNGQPEPRLGLQYHIDCKGKQLEYRISLNSENACRVYQLEIEELTLNFYETGIGFLGFHLNNWLHGAPEQILQINDFGRRIYPQFLLPESADNRLAGAKSNFLADEIKIVSSDKGLPKDDFSDFLKNAPQRPNESGWLIPGFIRGLLPAFLRIGKEGDGSVEISPLLDDRMFVVCWVGHGEWSNGMTIRGMEKPYETDSRWHRLIFVDGKWPGMANDELLSKLNKGHTNDRWGGYGTFFGASRYSFVALTDSQTGRKMVLPHIQSMYFQIVLLCLLQRGSIVRFSDEIARLASSEKASEKEAEALHRKYLQFINKIYFREVTPQEQGIELYKLLQEKMEIERDVQNLQKEIQDFFNLLKLQSDERQTEAMNTLTIVGSALLVPTLILAYYGLTDFPEFDKSWFTFDWTWKISGAGMAIGFLSAWLWVRARNSEYRYLAGLLAVLMVLGVLAAAVVLPKIWFKNLS